MLADPDKFMVRGNDPDGFINLSVGEPLFLRRHLQFPTTFEPVRQSSYPPYKGAGRLLEELKRLHPGKHVVVTNGAKGALMSAFYAYRKLLGKMAVYHEAPLWPSYPTLAGLSGLSFQSNPWTLGDTTFNRRYISAKTVLNNPDGRTTDKVELGHYDILDCAYCHPVYGWDGELPPHTVSVWSAAKLFGYSGDRVGWLVTEVPELADLAADYVEKTTSGVSTRSQEVVADVLAYIRMHVCEVARMYEDARTDLLYNCMQFVRTFGPAVRNAWGDTTYTGMFGWVEPRCKDFDAVLKEAKVLAVPGTACGDMMGPVRWRLSLGQEPAVVRMALESIGDVMRSQNGPP